MSVTYTNICLLFEHKVLVKIPVYKTVLNYYYPSIYDTWCLNDEMNTFQKTLSNWNILMELKLYFNRKKAWLSFKLFWNRLFSHYWFDHIYHLRWTKMHLRQQPFSCKIEKVKQFTLNQRNTLILILMLLNIFLKKKTKNSSPCFAFLLVWVDHCMND